MSFSTLCGFLNYFDHKRNNLQKEDITFLGLFMPFVPPVLNLSVLSKSVSKQLTRTFFQATAKRTDKIFDTTKTF